MPNLFFTLAVPPGDGSGASQDVSQLVARKTVVIEGGRDLSILPQVTLEGSHDGVTWFPLIGLDCDDCEIVFTAIVRFVRVTVAGFIAGTLPQVTIGAVVSAATAFFALPSPPAAGGVGASVVVGAQDALKTAAMISGPPLTDALVTLEGSQDGGVTFAPLVLLSGPGAFVNFEGTLDEIRLRTAPRLGVPGLVVATLGCEIVTSGAAATTINVEDEGAFVGMRPTLNFQGAGVQATDDGPNNRVNVQVTAANVTAATLPTPIHSGDASEVGISTEAARADHKHEVAIPGAPTQIDVGDAALSGGSTSLARADHQHALPAPFVVSLISPDAIGDIGSSPRVAREDHVHAAIMLGTPTTIQPDDVASGGVVDEFTRIDHRHGILADAPVTVRGAANAEGVSTAFSRADHDHRLELEVSEEGVLQGARPELNFIGPAVTAVDNPGADRVDVTIAAAAGASPAILGFGGGNVGAAAGTVFLDPWFGSNVSVAGGSIIEIVIPVLTGVIRNLFVRHNMAAGNGNSVVYTVMKNGVATGLTATLATGAIGQASDLVNTVAVVQGDRIGLKAVKALAIAAGDVSPVVSIELGSS